MARADSIARPVEDPGIELLHRTTTRPATPDNLCVLAFDHRRQLEELVVSTEPVGEKIAAFKSLVCDAVQKVAAESPDTNVGVIVDDRYGESVLAKLSAENWWIGRPVEIPGSRPVEFDPRNSMGLPLLEWPSSHVVKCLIFYHPDDNIELRLEQEDRVRQLHADCAALDRELLLEIIVTSAQQQCDDHTVANVMRRFYNLGVFPAWWKLESQSEAGWQEISSVIERYDPRCHGVLLLGLDAPEEDLRQSFKVAAQFPVCKGFAVGRSIFGDAARRWFDNQIDDNDAIELIADNYRRMISFWQESSAGTGKDKARSETA